MNSHLSDSLPPASRAEAGVPDPQAGRLQALSSHVYTWGGPCAPAFANSFGANAGVVVGNDAVLVVDTLISAGQAGQFLAAIRRLTSKPIRFVVNTHSHLDHTFGNGVFAEAGAVVIAHDNARRNYPRLVHTLAHPQERGLTPQDFAGTRLHRPDVTFSERLTLDLGEVGVELRYAGPSHMDDSLVVFVPQDRTLLAGDVLFSHCHPFLADGELAGWLKVLNVLGELPAERILPGHGPVSSKRDLEELQVYLEAFDRAARELCCGKQASEAQAIARQMLACLPEQGRIVQLELIERNLRARYLAAAS